MKKNIFVIIFMSMTITLFYACNKDEEVNSKSENLNEQSLKDAQLEKRIIAFRDKIDLIRENPTLKSGTDPMDIDSAVWYIESTSNLTYGDASFDNEEFVVDSAFIDVPLTNGEILWLDVQIAYNQIIDSLSAHYDEISAGEKQLIAADISLEETTQYSATFKVTSCFGIRTLIGIYSDFGVDDYWTWGASAQNYGGYCDGPNAGTQLDSDAAEEIEQKINGRRAVPAGNYYYTDISILLIEAWNGDNAISLDGVNCYDCSYLNTNDNIPNDNMYDYYIFRSYSEYSNHHDCLIPDEMNFYLDGMEDIVYTYAYQWYPYALDGKAFISIDILGDALFTYTTTYFHQCNVAYGIVHVSNLPPAEL